MLKFRRYIELQEEAQKIEEKLILLGPSAYPRFGQILILAGGAGSGKGFVLSNLVGLEGRVLDVDAIKGLALKSNIIRQKVKERLGYDLEQFNLKNPHDVYLLHDILKNEIRMIDKYQEAFYASVLGSPSERKPNIIFNVTLDKISKLHSLSYRVQDLGYKIENIHLIWVVNDINVALLQNKSRNRVVPEDIVLETHEGAAITMKKILDMGAGLKDYLDGTIAIAFNKAGVDSEVQKSSTSNTADNPVIKAKAASSGKFLSKANYVLVKKKGEKQIASDQLAKDVYDKIVEYTPKVKTW